MGGRNDKNLNDKNVAELEDIAQGLRSNVQAELARARIARDEEAAARGRLEKERQIIAELRREKDAEGRELALSLVEPFMKSINEASARFSEAASHAFLANSASGQGTAEGAGDAEGRAAGGSV